MNKGLLSQDDYGLKMRGILFITDHLVLHFHYDAQSFAEKADR